MSDNQGGSSSSPQGTQELTVFVQNLLQQMQSRFQDMSDTIIKRIDDMGTRIDDLEKSISELMAQAGIPEEQDQEGSNDKRVEPKYY
jgi:heat shock factor-binding protein 1